MTPVGSIDPSRTPSTVGAFQNMYSVIRRNRPTCACMFVCIEETDGMIGKGEETEICS